RFIDNNNFAGGDTIQYLSAVSIDSGTAGNFIDKPSLVVDIPRAGAGTCTIPAQGNAPAQQIPAGNAYLGYMVAAGNDKNPVTRMMVTRSTNCGATWSKPIKISERYHVNQGAALAIDPGTGNVYVVWREFSDTNTSSQILFAKSTTFGQTFSQSTVVSPINAFDQGGIA